MPSIFSIPLDVPGQLTITLRPRGGDWLSDDIAALRREGVEVLVSLLCADEEHELGLDREEERCDADGVAFVSLPVADLGVPPDSESFVRSVRQLAARIREGAHVAVHCRQSVGRSGLLAVSIAVACGMSLDAALDAVSTARGTGVPETRDQHEWLARNAARCATL